MSIDDDEFKDFVDSVDNETLNDEPEPEAEPEPTPTPEPEPEPEPTPEPEPPAEEIDVDNVVAGYSSAYGIKPSELQTKAETPKGKEPTPPKRSESKGGGAKEIMAVFWDMILDVYGWCIDKAVDIPLEFIEWVLYAKPHNDAPPQGGSLLDVANKKKEDFIKKIDETNQNAIKVHKEMDKNTDILANGGAVSWTTLDALIPGKAREIKLYVENKLVPAYRAYQTNPDAPEARDYKNFKKIPEILEKSGNKIKTIGSFAHSLAAIEILASEDADYMPEGFSRKYKELQDKVSSLSVDYIAVGNITDDLLTNLPSGEAFDLIRENLTEIKQKTTLSDKSGIKKCIKNINKDITDNDTSAKYKEYKIVEKTMVHFGKILANIDKIYEECGTDVDKRNETIKQYCHHINDAIASVAKVASEADDEVRKNIKISDRKRKKLQKAVDSIDSFDFDGRPIHAHATARRQSRNIYDNAGVIYDYMMGRV